MIGGPPEAWNESEWLQQAEMAYERRPANSPASTALEQIASELNHLVGIQDQRGALLVRVARDQHDDTAEHTDAVAKATAAVLGCAPDDARDGVS